MPSWGMRWCANSPSDEDTAKKFRSTQCEHTEEGAVQYTVTHFENQTFVAFLRDE